MRVTWQGAALRATARLVFGSGAGAVLGSSAVGFGLVGCGGQTARDGVASAPPPASADGATVATDGGATSASVMASAPEHAGETGAAGGAGYLVSSGGTATGNVVGGGTNAGGAATGDASAGGMASDLGGAGVGGAASSTCIGPTALGRPSTPPGPTQAEFDCCLDLVSNASRDSPSLLGRDPAVNCCRAIITAVDLDGSRYTKAGAVRTACCNASVADVGELYQHNFCAPWGPPTPPELDWRAA